MDRKIKNLAEMNGRVYVYISNFDLGKTFLQMAKDEGFTFTDGANPTEKHCAEIMAVNHDNTINYVGANGRIAFGSGAKKIGNQNLIRIDFEKYIADDEDYYYNK